MSRAISTQFRPGEICRKLCFRCFKYLHSPTVGRVYIFCESLRNLPSLIVSFRRRERINSKICAKIRNREVYFEVVSCVRMLWILSSSCIEKYRNLGFTMFSVPLTKLQVCFFVILLLEKPLDQIILKFSTYRRNENF